MVVEPRVVRRFGLRERYLPSICITEGVRDPLKGCLESEGHSVLHIELIKVYISFSWSTILVEDFSFGVNKW